MKQGHLYDVDGDGKADSAADVSGSYFAWAPAFVAMVRKRLGDGAVILANSAGSISDSSLSGITIEMEACTTSTPSLSPTKPSAIEVDESQSSRSPANARLARILRRRVHKIGGIRTLTRVL